MAADTQGEVPIFDFPVMSNDGAPKEPKPGQTWTEKVWSLNPPPKWNKGELLGSVEIQAQGPPGSPNFHAHFTFDAYPDMDVDGRVPGGDRWQGLGRGKAKGPKPDKDVDIEFENPKRWG
ncbi:MAG TPA: hypothetical protein VKC55_03100 [Actinomycetota bacterium]|nr:hypothetical protein [Actinomycetota bacterium]